MALGRARAALGMNKNKIKDFIPKSQNVYNLMSVDPRFAASPVAYATVAQQITDLTKANQSVAAKIPGMVPTRDQRRDVLFASMESLRGFVQMLADASPAQASILITAAGMLVWALPVRSKAILAAETTLPSGTVALQANATLLLAGMGSKRPTFNWSYTLDGKAFLSAPSTPEARTTIANLPPLTTVGFRVSVTVAKMPPGDWSQVVSVLVR